jgi:2,3-bisphosphoglycerate-independent phosphoglycerate mutase
LKPIIVDANGCVRDDDTMMFFNYRSDRMRQICQTFGKIGGAHPFEVAVERKNLVFLAFYQLFPFIW